MTVEEFLRVWLKMRRDELEALKEARNIEGYKIEWTTFDNQKEKTEIKVTVRPTATPGESFVMTTVLEHVPREKGELEDVEEVPPIPHGSTDEDVPTWGEGDDDVPF